MSIDRRALEVSFDEKSRLRKEWKSHLNNRMGCKLWMLRNRTVPQWLLQLIVDEGNSNTEANWCILMEKVMERFAHKFEIISIMRWNLKQFIESSAWVSSRQVCREGRCGNKLMCTATDTCRLLCECEATSIYLSVKNLSVSSSDRESCPLFLRKWVTHVVVDDNLFSEIILSRTMETR